MPALTFTKLLVLSLVLGCIATAPCKTSMDCALSGDCVNGACGK
jgi:hypothetical protein